MPHADGEQRTNRSTTATVGNGDDGGFDNDDGAVGVDKHGNDDVDDDAAAAGQTVHR
jgi:hypothetical protein